VADAYSRKWRDDDDEAESRRRRKPDCYGDPEVFDPDDDDCDRCPWRAACKVVIDRKSKTRSRSRSNRRSRSSRDDRDDRDSRIIKRRGSTSVREAPPDEDDTWSSVLGYNAMVEAAQGMADELSNAVGHIPRKRYPNILAKRKRRVIDAEEDD